MPGEKIEAGDEVLHRPSGQKWAILGVDSERGYILPMGWPFQLEKLADCELAPDGKGKHKKHVDAAALRTRKEKFGRRFDDDREEDARMDREWAL
jgi:hypothetical protein